MFSQDSACGRETLQPHLKVFLVLALATQMELLEASQGCRHSLLFQVLSCSIVQLTPVVQSPFLVAQNQLKELYNKQVLFWTNKPGFPFNQLRI